MKMDKPNKKRVFVAMSGGVDSSVAAYLLKKQGYDVVGVFMRCFNIDGCAEKDAEDARRVAEKLKIPFYVFNFEDEYKKKVVNYMISGYKKGITPNPDVMCNKEIKFGLFLGKALALGADYIATGHYVKLKSNSLFEAKDKNKDQSYFLWTLTQEQLRCCLFPIGDYLKSKVRETARRAGLPTAEKKDSQGICFLGQVRLGDFLAQYIKPKIGQVRLALADGSYKIIGEHQGVQFYTIGQRHLGLSNIKYQKSNSAPMYVAEKNIKTNTLVVAEREDNPALYKREVELSDARFINPQHPYMLKNVGMSVLARVRYRQPLAPAKLVRRKAIKSLMSNIYLLFTNPVKFVAPGQSAVFYNKIGEVLGGGIIK
jgi:tRNA-specific 2-thiouridylase